MSHPPAYKLYENEPRPPVHWNTPGGQWVGIWGYDWADILAREVLNATNGFEYEVWQPDLRANTVYAHTFDEGWVHKLFPAKAKYRFYGLKRRKEIYSRSMLLELNKLKKRHNEVVLHLGVDDSCLPRLLLSYGYGRFPIVNQSYGDFAQPFRQVERESILKTAHQWLIRMNHKQYYSRISDIIILKSEGVNVLRQNTSVHIHKARWGIDFREWSIDKSKEEARDLLDIPLDKYVIFSSSRLTSIKQIDRLVEVLRDIKKRNYICYISGHGTEEDENELKRLVEESGMQNHVVFIGYVDVDTLRNYYLAADLFISTSISEAGPYSSMLAAALERPIMTTDTGVMSEVLKKKGAGCILPVYNYHVWRRQISKAISGWKIRTLRRSEVISMFSWNCIAKDYAEIYKKVMRDFRGR
jgi:glycosyltransferase involved in cell wall biosynthesis